MTIESELCAFIDDPETQWALGRDVLEWAREYGDDNQRAWLECVRADYGIALSFVRGNQARAVAEEAFDVAREIAPLLEGEHAEWARRVVARPQLEATAEDQAFENAIGDEAALVIKSLGARAEELMKKRAALPAARAPLVRVEAEIGREPNAEYLRLSREIHACFGVQQGVHVIASAASAALHAAVAEKLPQTPPQWNELARDMVRVGRRARSYAFGIAAMVMERAPLAVAFLTMKDDAREVLELAVMESDPEDRFEDAHARLVERLDARRDGWSRSKMDEMRSRLIIRSFVIQLERMRANIVPGEVADAIDVALAIVRTPPVDVAALVATLQTLREKGHLDGFDEAPLEIASTRRPN